MPLGKYLWILKYSKVLAKHLTMEMWSPGSWSQWLHSNGNRVKGITPLAPGHPDGHSCLLMEGLRASPDQRTTWLLPWRTESSLSTLTHTSSLKLGCQGKLLVFSVKILYLKNISHFFYRLFPNLDLFDVFLCLKSGYTFGKEYPKSDVCPSQSFLSEGTHHLTVSLLVMLNFIPC